MNKKDIKKQIWLRLLIVLAYLMAITLFAISLCMGPEWNIGVVISAIIFLVCMLIIIIRPLISNEKMRIIDWIEVSFSFIGAITLVIAFASASESNVKDAVVQISAASIGGLLTLYGVGITIKYNQLQRKEDEIKRIRPLFSFNMVRKEPVFDSPISKVCISDSSQEGVYSCEVFVEIENSNLSAFEITRIYHDGIWVGVECNKVVLPSAKHYLNFYFNSNPTLLFLEVEDILKNKYYYQMKALFLGSKTSSGRMFHTIREINEVPASFIDSIQTKKEISNN